MSETWEWDEEQVKKPVVIESYVIAGTVEQARKTVEVQHKTSTLPEQAKSIKVANNDQYAAAAEFLKGIKSLRAEVDAAFDPIISKAHAAHKEACGQKNRAEAPLTEAEGIVKRSIAVYLIEQERVRLAEENRIRAEHAARIRAQAEEEQMKAAQRALDEGDVDEAAAIVDAKVDVEVPDIPVHVESTVPKIAGVSARKTYSVVSVALRELVNAVATGKAPIEALRANDAFLGQQARSFKKVGELFPGVQVGVDTGIASGRG